jgi:hypothetical protein
MRILEREASVPSPDKPDRTNRGMDWPRILAVLVVQLAVLLVLSGAAIFYLDWSSDAAQAEFMAATKPLASDPSHLPQWSIPAQTVKRRTVCTPKA